MDWRDRPVFVTGATGLLGRWLVPMLCDLGATVTALVRDRVPASPLDPRATEVRGVVEDADLCRRIMTEYETDTVFHLAAQTIIGTARRDPLATFRTNVGGTWNVLDGARRAGVRRIIVASSDKVYGVHPGVCDEQLPLRGRSPYDVSKVCADHLALSYGAVVTRSGNMFGGGDLNWNRLVPGTIRSAMRGTRPILRSDGTMVRDYVFVQDVVRAYQLLAEHPEAVGAYNIGANPMPTMEMCRLILACADRPDLEPVIGGPASDEIPSQMLDATRLRGLGWAPSEIHAGLRETVQWYLEHL